MTSVRELHAQAMDLAETAFLAAKRGDKQEAERLNRHAFELEQQAAGLLSSTEAPEPTRSIIHRSAAVLAIDCGELRKAEQLIAAALAGNPPAEITEELRDLLDKVSFQRHLDLRGVSLAPDEFQLSIAGSIVGPGIARSDALIGRLRDVQSLLVRTISRKAKKPYSDHESTKTLPRDYSIWFSMPRASSYAVSIKIGQPEQLPLSGIEGGAEIIDEVLSCLDLLNSGDNDGLKERIPDPAYRRNFTALAQRIAPDGSDITTVGLTAFRGGTERRVALRRRQASISVPPKPPPSGLLEPPATPTVEVRGELKYADARSGAREIILVGPNGKEHAIVVPKGMMADVVRPLWENTVIVRGTLVKGKIHLQQIHQAED